MTQQKDTWVGCVMTIGGGKTYKPWEEDICCAVNIVRIFKDINQFTDCYTLILLRHGYVMTVKLWKNI